MYVYSYRWILSQIRTPSHAPSHSIFDFRRTSCTILSCYYRLGFLVEFRFLGAVLPFLQRCNFLVTFHLFSLARRIYSYTNRNNHVIREVHSKYKSPCVKLIPQKKKCACTDIITNRVVVFLVYWGSSAIPTTSFTPSMHYASCPSSYSGTSSLSSHGFSGSLLPRMRARTEKTMRIA